MSHPFHSHAVHIFACRLCFNSFFARFCLLFISVSCFFALFHFHYHWNCQGKPNENAQTMKITYETVLISVYLWVCVAEWLSFDHFVPNEKNVKWWRATNSYTRAQSNTFAAHHIYGHANSEKSSQLSKSEMERIKQLEEKRQRTHTHTHSYRGRTHSIEKWAKAIKIHRI